MMFLKLVCFIISSYFCIVSETIALKTVIIFFLHILSKKINPDIFFYKEYEVTYSWRFVTSVAQSKNKEY